MKVALIGYGKMGHEIERILTTRGHTVELIIDFDNQQLMTQEAFQNIDVAIEFTTPSTAAENVKRCLEWNVPVVCGTTGWNVDEAKQLCNKVGGTFFYASNFSLGVNILFKINEVLAEIMNRFPEYDVSLCEVHHLRKVDKPSGTADFLAKQLIEILDVKTDYINELTAVKSLIGVESVREGEVPGIHTVHYESDADVIEIQHVAKNRSGFALGAVMAAEYTQEHKGILTMNNLLKI